MRFGSRGLEGSYQTTEEMNPTRNQSEGGRKKNKKKNGREETQASPDQERWREYSPRTQMEKVNK